MFPVDASCNSGFLKTIILAEDIRYRVLISKIIIGKHIRSKAKSDLNCIYSQRERKYQMFIWYRMPFFFFFFWSISCCVEYFASTVLPDS